MEARLQQLEEELEEEQSNSEMLNDKARKSLNQVNIRFSTFMEIAHTKCYFKLPLIFSPSVTPDCHCCPPIVTQFHLSPVN
jgi:hypothetical protein